MTGGILALDLATVTGWAHVSPLALASWPKTALEAASMPGLPFDVGTQQFPKTGTDVGRFADAFHNWLVSMIEERRPDSLVFEAPYADSKRHQQTARKLLGLAWHTEWCCLRMGVRCSEANMTEYRKHFTGVGQAKRERMKALVMESCRARGWEVADDNEADAMALLDFAVACWRPGRVAA